MTTGTTKVQTAAEVGLALIQQLDEQNEQLSIGIATVKNAFDLEIRNILHLAHSCLASRWSLIWWSLHVCLPHQARPLRSEPCVRGAPMNVAHAECMKMCTVEERIQLLKG